MKYQLLIVVLLGLSLGSPSGWAGATDISGMWACDIHRGGETKPLTLTFVLKQAAEKLTGTYYARTRDEEKVTATANGNNVVFSYESKPPAAIKKPGLTVTFNGTIVSPSKITGVIGTPFCGEAECKWTATKKK